MKSFLSLFLDSFNELKKIRTITVTGLLIALAVIIKIFAIQITPTTRISFGFIAIMAIAMLYGPVVSGMSGFLVDFLSYIVADKTGNPYMPVMGLVFLLSGMVYGLFLYKTDEKSTGNIIVRAVLARITSVAFCQLGLNSILIYLMYVNKDFDITSASQLTAFGSWWLIKRLPKSAAQLPIDIALVISMIPVIRIAYKRVFKANKAISA